MSSQFLNWLLLFMFGGIWLVIGEHQIAWTCLVGSIIIASRKDFK